jgi:hypothetical protein
MKQIVYGPGGFDPSKPNNNIIEQYEVEDVQAPLDATGVAATLNAVLGLWTLQDAANAVSLTPDDLINEANAWAVAANNTEDI